MLRRWVKVLPYFMIERYILKKSSIFCKLDGDPVQAWELRDGVFLVKSEKKVLLDRKWELERELAQLEKRLRGEKDSEEIGPNS
jgi:hypothetical protein